MKRIIFTVLIALLVLSMVFGLSSCGNKQFFDTTYTFNQAIIYLPDGTIVNGEVNSWTDYEDGDQIQVVIDGTTYLVHSSNVVLIKN